MALVSMDPSASNWPYLTAGKYGPGMDHEAECEITEYEFPALEAPRFAPEDPPESWAKMRIKVRVEGGISTVLFVDIPIGPNSGSRLGDWLTALGINVSDDGTFAHDPDHLPGTKCAVEVGDPRKDKNDPKKFYTGNVRGLFGV